MYDSDAENSYESMKKVLKASQILGENELLRQNLSKEERADIFYNIFWFTRWIVKYMYNSMIDRIRNPGAHEEDYYEWNRI